MSSETRYLYEFGAFRLDPAERLLLREGKPVALPPKAFLTLVLLVERSGRVQEKQELMQAVWPGTFVEENNLTQCISILRKTLGENGDGERFIETVPKLGYRFVAPVRRSLAETAAEQFSVLHHSHARIVIRHEEQIEEDEELESSPAAPPGNVESARTEAAAQIRQSFLLRHYRLAATAVLCLTLGVAAYLWLRPTQPPQILDYVVIATMNEVAMPMAADDTYLYFTAPSNRLWKLPVKGGEATVVPLNMPVVPVLITDFSPARQEALALLGPLSSEPEEYELWVVTVSSSGPRRVGDLYAHDARWSPDGKSILYGHRNNLYTAQADGTHLHLLAGLSGRAAAPRWSPDGQWIRFAITEGDTSSLWEVAADGSGLRSLLQDVSFPGQWTPDGRYFILAVRRTGRVELWAVPRTGGPRMAAIQPANLRSGPMSLAFPVLSPSGRQVFAAGWVQRVELIRHNAVSNSFTPFLSGVSTDGLAFSADGQWVAYSSFPERTLWRSRVDGSQQLQLTFGRMEALLPRWSPDGKSIAFMGRSPGQPWQICRLPASGGSAEPLVPGPDDQATPAWSPDGNTLVFAGAPWLNGFAANSTAIYRVDLSTRQVSTLPGSGGLWSPRWSPDGRYVVAETVDSNRLKLFDFRKQKWESLAEISGDLLGYSAWSHDSKYVYFNGYDERNNRVYRVNVEGTHRVATVLDLSSMHSPEPSANGSRLLQTIQF